MNPIATQLEINFEEPLLACFGGTVHVTASEIEQYKEWFSIFTFPDTGEHAGKWASVSIDACVCRIEAYHGKLTPAEKSDPAALIGKYRRFLEYAEDVAFHAGPPIITQAMVDRVDQNGGPRNSFIDRGLETELDAIVATAKRMLPWYAPLNRQGIVSSI